MVKKIKVNDKVKVISGGHKNIIGTIHKFNKENVYLKELTTTRKILDKDKLKTLEISANIKINKKLSLIKKIKKEVKKYIRIHFSNVQLYDEKNNTVFRVKIEDGKRKNKKTNEII